MMDVPDEDKESERSEQNKTNIVAAQYEKVKPTHECEPCQISGKKGKQAQFYCNECDEKYCDVCSISHKTQRATKGHEVVDLLDLIKTAKLCDPCQYQKRGSKAVFVCKECNKFLCGDCKVAHLSQRHFKNHQMVPIQENLFCQPCAENDKEVVAVGFCEDCEEPELYCAVCSDQHKAMKKTRNHTINMDTIEYILKMQQKEVDHRLMLTEDKRLLTLSAVKEDLSLEAEKPYMSERKSYEIELQWHSTRQLSDTELYNIMYKEHPGGKWKNYSTNEPCLQSKITIKRLKPDTSYVFKVKVLDESTGKESEFTGESDPITTKPSPALHILKSCEKIENGPPKVYRLPIKENFSARNEKAKTRKFTLGDLVNITYKERTIMVVGATGSGKSTLINGMANYIIGVTWEDPFRFTLINLETSEQERAGNEALSQTDWVTCYTIYTSVSDRLDYNINIIDTPGFGDTKGLEHDHTIIDQFRQLFTAKGEKGVATLDAVCFILKAPDARLTHTQRYIFESILALFGNNIQNNICTLVTFADGQRPPVLSGIQAIDGVPLPFDTYFTFNNSALFAENNPRSRNDLSPFFWEMGIQSCKTFFDHVKKMQTKSLSLTAEVLVSRKKLENTIYNLQQEIEVGLCQVTTLRKEWAIFNDNAKEIRANKNFKYNVTELHAYTVDLSGTGQYALNCLICNKTCHEYCTYTNDDNKAKCIAMDSNGNCTVCPSSCSWLTHKSTPFIIKFRERTLTKKYTEIEKKYEKAKRETLSQIQVLNKIAEEVLQIENQVQLMMETITRLDNRLKEIALRPDPLSTAQYIELMIQTEKREKKFGFEARIDSLDKCKKRAEHGASVKIVCDRIYKSLPFNEAASEILKDDGASIVFSKTNNYNTPTICQIY